jgi:hypothetical protein
LPYPPLHGVVLADSPSATVYYFSRERIESIRTALGLPRLDDESRPRLFAKFVAEMDMSASYKPVMLLALLERVDSSGKAGLADVVCSFREFYERRKADGLVVERAGTRMARVGELDDAEVRRLMLEMPFEKFERRRYLKYDRDLAYLRFDPVLWRQFKREDLERIRALCREAIAEYYERLGDS